MKLFQKKQFAVLLSTILMFSSFLGNVSTSAESRTVGLNVEVRTQQEIIDHIGHLMSLPEYKVAPNFNAPYTMGCLSDKTLQDALDTLNLVRYIAGISDNVVLDDNYNQLTQAGALVNYLNKDLNHSPAKPADMDDELYSLGVTGSGRSNIAWASWQKCSLSRTIMYSWMEDGDSSNFSRVGHRRWILNPSMKKTGFGCVWGSNGTYSQVYAFDRSGSNSYYGVAWPAQNMPVEYFGSNYPWSISLGKYVQDATVVLTRKNDGSSWIFNSSSASNEFSINNDGYGQSGCIIFRPNDVGTYKAGDEFNVRIMGTGVDVEYTVNFFSVVSSDDSNPSNSESETETELESEIETESETETESESETETESESESETEDDGNDFEDDEEYEDDDDFECDHMFTSILNRIPATFKFDGITEGEVCILCDEILIPQKIVKRIKTVKLSKSVYAYNGKIKNPALVIKDSSGKSISSSNYKLSKSSGRKKVGKHAYKISFKGNYSGSKTLNFTIVPKATEIKSIKAGKKSIKVTIKKITTQTSGYEIQLSTDKNFKKNVEKCVIKSNKTVSKNFTKLKYRKKYYVRVRTYKSVSGKKYNSSWTKYKKTVLPK